MKSLETQLLHQTFKPPLMLAAPLTRNKVNQSATKAELYKTFHKNPEPPLTALLR